MSLKVRQHTGLQIRGGAVRVAQLIGAGLENLGHDSTESFEFAEARDSCSISPQLVGQDLEPGEILHLHSSGDWPALLKSIPAGTPLVLTLHDAELITGGCPYPLDCPGFELDCAEPCPRGFSGSYGKRKLKIELLKSLSPRLAAPSGWLAGLAGEALGQKPKVIPNGVPWNRPAMSKRQARKQLGVAPEAAIALFAAHGGAVAGYKSGDKWPDYWREIKSRVPSALGFAVGGDKAGREGDLLTWPYVDRDRLELLMSAADALLYPTRADNHPLVILEAMAAGLACVSYSVGGIPEQIVHGRTGVLVPPDDFQVFVQGSVDLLGNRTLARELGLNARDFGAGRFSAERMVNDYVKIYETM